MSSTYLNTTSSSIIITFLSILLLTTLTVITGFIPAIVYIFLIFILMLLGINFDKKRKNNKQYKVLTILILTLFVGLRDFGIGTDTNVYIHDYFNNADLINNFTDLINSEKDKGFLLLAIIARLLGDNAQNLLFITALFIYIFTFSSIKRFKKNNIRISLTIYTFIWCFTFFNDSMNIMRQFCAMSLILYGFSYLLDKNWKTYIILQFCAFFMHSSSIIALPLLGIYYLSSFPDKRKRNLITILLLIGLLFAIGSVFMLLPIFAHLGIISEIYADRYGANSEFSSVYIFGPGFIAKSVIIYLLIYYNKKKGTLNDKMAYLSYTIHSTAIILRLTALYVIYLSRISMYYDYIDIFLLAIILSNNKASKIYVYGICFCIIYLWYTSYIIGNSAETYPYKSQILNI